MELNARKVQAYGDWYKEWSLQDKECFIYGRVIYNAHRESSGRYTVFIGSNIHPELGNIAWQSFGTLSDALSWARVQIENLPVPTAEDYEDAIKRVKDARYQDEMSDDFAYSNGKVARWDRIESELRNMMENAK